MWLFSLYFVIHQNFNWFTICVIWICSSKNLEREVVFKLEVVNTTIRKELILATMFMDQVELSTGVSPETCWYMGEADLEHPG